MFDALHSHSLLLTHVGAPRLTHLLSICRYRKVEEGGTAEGEKATVEEEGGTAEGEKATVEGAAMGAMEAGTVGEVGDTVIV